MIFRCWILLWIFFSHLYWDREVKWCCIETKLASKCFAIQFLPIKVTKEQSKQYSDNSLTKILGENKSFSSTKKGKQPVTIVKSSLSNRNFNNGEHARKKWQQSQIQGLLKYVLNFIVNDTHKEWENKRENITLKWKNNVQKKTPNRSK